jgi:hypothetical protein
MDTPGKDYNDSTQEQHPALLFWPVAILWASDLLAEACIDLFRLVSGEL